MTDRPEMLSLALIVLLAACSSAGDGGSTGPGNISTPPAAPLTHSPSNPTVGEMVTLDASGSSDSDGTVVEYRWDVDGDGSVEAITTSATRSHSYGSTGEKTPVVTG